MKNMKVGIIGCGGISPAHMAAYKNIENVELVALCDLDAQRAKTLAKKFNVKNTYTDYWEMFKKEDLDSVDICTPLTTHAKIVCDAAEAVPAILLEKPMALNVSQCKEMVKKTEKTGTKLSIAHCQIFSPNIKKAKSIADSELFNLLTFHTTLKASFENLRAHNLASPWNVLPEQRGIIWEVCSHHAYLQLHFLPDIKEVYALGEKAKYSVYDDFAVLLRTSGKRYGMIEISWIPNETEVIYELKDSAGRRVTINWEYDYLLEKNLSPPLTVGLVAKNVLVDFKRYLKKWTRFGLSYIQKRKMLPIQNVVKEYVNAIQNDLPVPVTPQDGMNTINLLECIETSLNEKRSVHFTKN